MDHRNVRNHALCWGGLALLSLSVLLALAGCGKSPPPAPVVLQSGPTGTVWELPIYQVREIPAEAAKDADDIVGVVTVQPSARPTTVKVYKRQKSVQRRIEEAVTGTSGSPDYTATSDNEAATFTTEKQRGLWPWLLLLVLLAGGGWFARGWLRRISWITKFFR